VGPTPTAAAFTGGYETLNPADAPWYVSIRVTNANVSAICSGVLTTARTVATAAHCILGDSGTTYTVYRDIPGRGESLQGYAPTVVSGPGFADLGRLFLPRTFPGSVPAPAERSLVRSRVMDKDGYLYGTGVVPDGTGGLTDATHINRLRVFTQEADPPKRLMFWAGHMEATMEHSCSGDSGGPLMIGKEGPRGTTTLVLVGLISGGWGACASGGNPITVIGWIGGQDGLFVAPG